MALLDSYIKGKKAATLVTEDDAAVSKSAPTWWGQGPSKKTPDAVSALSIDKTAPVVPASETPAATGVQGYLKRTLEGNNPLVQNAQATQDTSSAVQRYLAGKTARNTSAQAGFDPGTLQEQRVQDRATAGADQSILQGQNQVNDLTRDISQQALSDKSALDSSAISSVTDPKAKNYLQTVLASGGDVQEALAGMYENGVLKPEYSSGTPAQQNKKAIEDTVEVLGFVRGTPEFEAEVLRRLNLSDKATNAPVETEVTEASISSVQQKARSGQALTEDEITLLSENTDQVASSALPSTREAIEAAMSDNPFVKLEDGKVYQIQDYYQQQRRNTSRERNSDWTVLKDVSTGKTVYVRSDGVQIDYKPPDPEKGHKIRYNSQKGVWEELYGSSGGPTGKVYDPASQKWISPGRTDG